jgi:hypothetical protein
MCYREVQPTDYMTFEQILEQVRPGYQPTPKFIIGFEDGEHHEVQEHAA